MVHYRENLILLTKIVDFLPLLETKEKSILTAQGEFAHLIPGHQRAIGENGTAYIDDFEASSTGIDIKNPGAWFLASLPNDPNLFPESALPNQSPRLGNLNSGKIEHYYLGTILTQYFTEILIIPQDI